MGEVQCPYSTRSSPRTFPIHSIVFNIAILSKQLKEVIVSSHAELDLVNVLAFSHQNQLLLAWSQHGRAFRDPAHLMIKKFFYIVLFLNCFIHLLKKSFERTVKTAFKAFKKRYCV